MHGYAYRLMSALKAADMTQTSVKITPFIGRTTVKWAFSGAHEHFGRIQAGSENIVIFSKISNFYIFNIYIYIQCVPKKVTPK